MSLKITPEQVYEGYYLEIRRNELVNKFTPVLEDLFGQEYHIGRVANLFSLLSRYCFDKPKCRSHLEKMQLVILMELTNPVLLLQNTRGLQASVVMESGSGWKIDEGKGSKQEVFDRTPEFQYIRALIFL